MKLLHKDKNGRTIEEYSLRFSEEDTSAYEEDSYRCDIDHVTLFKGDTLEVMEDGDW